MGLHTLATTLVAAFAACLAANIARAVPLAITWADLIPAAVITGKDVHLLEGVVQHSQVSSAPESSAAATPSTSIEELLGISSGTAFRNDLDRTEVKLSGFVLPLAFSGTKVTEFLLVPFVGACVHVPPPPANQLVLVSVPGGYASGGLWEAVSVTGVLSVSTISTELAKVGYSLAANGVSKL
jgi:hypothetical protein